MLPTFNQQAPKKPTNLSINSDLLRQAKAFDINLSQTLEQALTEALRSRHKEQWLKENNAAINAYNQHVDEQGVYSDNLRSF